VPQKEQAQWGITAFPHCGQLFKVLGFKLWWDLLCPTELLVLFFLGTDIFYPKIKNPKLNSFLKQFSFTDS